MKSIKFLMLAILLVLCFTLPSYSKNDEVLQPPFIVGEWFDGTGNDSEKITVIFYQNGAFTCKKIIYNEFVEEFSGTYVYNETNSKGTLISSGGGTITMNYVNGKMIFVDDKGPIFILRKR